MGLKPGAICTPDVSAYPAGRMQRMLWMTAGLIAAAGIAWWLVAGRNTGWTKTSVPIRELDPVTEIESTTYHKAFLPGVDFLAATLAGAGALGAVGWMVGRSSKSSLKS
jgi:hypothetical protein